MLLSATGQNSLLLLSESGLTEFTYKQEFMVIHLTTITSISKYIFNIFLQILKYNSFGTTEK